MKLSKSKLALAKVINENGGWPSDEANFAAQDKIDGESNDNTISFYSGKVKPARLTNNSMWRCESSGSHFMGYEKTIMRCKLLPNWHQTCLSREEYYQAYPKADADGWIEWNGGECPVENGLMVDIRVRDGREERNLAANTLTKGRTPDASCAFWKNDGMAGDIIAYRLNKPEVKPEFCESVMRSIPEPSPKPTIEQLAHDYRNKLYFAKRKQQEADDAKVAADAALGELERAGEALGLLIGIAKPDREPELVITDWRDLMVGDEVECIKDNIGNKYSGVIGVVQSIDYDDVSTPVCVDIDEVGGIWCHKVKFIRRP